MGIADNIIKLREKYSLTQAELGEIAGVTDRAVSAWEKGVAEPRMGAVQKIADHFNIKKSEIVDDLDDQIHTIAAHHDGEDWTEEELNEIEEFKKFVLSKRKNK